MRKTATRTVEGDGGQDSCSSEVRFYDFAYDVFHGLDSLCTDFRVWTYSIFKFVGKHTRRRLYMDFNSFFASTHVS